MEADITSQAVGLASSADFSLINLFIRADIVVKSVIIMLIACSIYSWAVIIEKYRLFKKIKNKYMVRKFIMKLAKELNNLKKIKLELLLNTFLQCLAKALLVCLILDNRLEF